MLAESNNIASYFIYYKKEKYLLDNKKQDIEEDQRDLIGKNSDNKSIKDMLLRCTLQNKLFTSELSSLREIGLSE